MCPMILCLLRYKARGLHEASTGWLQQLYILEIDAVVTMIEKVLENTDNYLYILEIDAVVTMIEKVLENTDNYLQEEVSTRGLTSHSNYGNFNLQMTLLLLYIC